MQKMMLMISTFSLLSLVACGHTAFDCPKSAGVNCQSLDTIQAKVDKGEIHGQASLDEATLEKRTAVKNVEPLALQQAACFWIAPFTDSAGHRHAEQWLTPAGEPLTQQGAV